MKISVCVDTEGMVRNQRYAFTNRFSLVSELLQNARRAGARQITVEHHPQTGGLTVQDDGCGIADFQDLLRFHASGWDAATVEAEQPFGIGFTKCLYAASRVRVTSGAQRMDCDSLRALRGEPVDVLPCEGAVTGTLVELEGVDIPDLASRIERLCQGFPVEVLFNGQRLQRRYAEDRLDWLQTPVGAVHLTGRRDGRTSQETLVFLQGFCVQAPPYFCDRPTNVVHLDPRRFVARLPDRDTLIDADRQLREVQAALRSAWRRVLCAERAVLPPQQFADLYFAAMRSWDHLDLLNELDALPGALFHSIVAYPTQTPGYERPYLRRVAVAPSRDDIEQGRVRLVTLDRLGEHNAAHWLLARHTQCLVFEAYHLDLQHWARRHVRNLDEQEIQVQAQDETARVVLPGRKVQPLVMLCRSVRIRVGDDAIELTDEAVVHEGLVMVPAGETSGEAVRQLSDYLDANDRLLEDDLASDREALAGLIQRLRCTDPAATLHALLAGLRLGTYPQLHGKSFQVTLGDGGMPGYTVDLRTPATARPHGRGVHRARR